MSDSVGQYLNEIGLVPLLTAQEERELAQVIEAGHEAREKLASGETSVELRRADRAAAKAKDRFIRSNLRLVVSIARRYPLPPGMELLDLIQEGNIGLEHAVDKFDWRKGFKFSTYATFWIRQAIGRALDQKASLVRLPGDRSAALRAALLAHDPLRLAALTPLVTIGGSLVAGLALAEGAFTADALWEAVSLDELYQERRWGADSEAQKARARREADWHHAARFLSLL